MPLCAVVAAKAFGCCCSLLYCILSCYFLARLHKDKAALIFTAIPLSMGGIFALDSNAFFSISAGVNLLRCLALPF
jgi:hypothetical protein